MLKSFSNIQPAVRALSMVFGSGAMKMIVRGAQLFAVQKWHMIRLSPAGSSTWLSCEKELDSSEN